ncbi:MAG: hypothetical protein FJ222_06035 [Lentisphaerae bacterium]|nr:hypothetical protein [Lentisphaerota bacterium]
MSIQTQTCPDGCAASASRNEVLPRAVRRTRYDILTELAPTRHAAIYRFTFPASDDAHLMLDLAHSIPGDINRKGDTVLAFTMSEQPTAWGTHQPPTSDVSPCVETTFN